MWKLYQYIHVHCSSRTIWFTFTNPFQSLADDGANMIIFISWSIPHLSPHINHIQLYHNGNLNICCFNKKCRKKLKHAFNILKQTGVSIIVFWDLYFSNMAPNCCHHLVSTSHSLGEQCPQSTRFPPRPGSVASPQQCLCVPDRSGPSQGTPVTLSRWG